MNSYSILHLVVVYYAFDFFFLINFKGPSFMDM